MGVSVTSDAHRSRRFAALPHPDPSGPQAQPSGVHRRADQWSANAPLHPPQAGEGTVARRAPGRWLDRRTLIVTKSLVHALALTPAAILARRIWVTAQGSDALGADPVAAITHFTGDWALRFVLITLAVTPLRRLTGWAPALRFRRMLGLYAFFYACAHFATYLVLDLGGYWAQVLEDIVERPYITVGFSAWLILLALAATSTKGSIRRLGRLWVRLHSLVYAVGILAVLHYLWQVKSDVREPLLYAAILAVLLGLRLWWRLRRPATPASAKPPSRMAPIGEATPGPARNLR